MFSTQSLKFKLFFILFLLFFRYHMKVAFYFFSPYLLPLSFSRSQSIPYTT